jgi:DNA-binding Lrp family transcriptional regulator
MPAMRQNAASLDRYDRAILARYQHDTQVPAKVIAEAVGLSAAAVQRRLKRLREARVIEREVALLDPKSVGLPVTCLVSIDLERERAGDLERFRRKVQKAPEVQQCYYVTGASDFVLIVLAASMEAYEAFTRRELLEDPNVRGFTTFVVLDRVKVGLSAPLGDGVGPARRTRAATPAP